jgi:hypothetical protein
MTAVGTRRDRAECAVQRAETVLSNAYESGNDDPIQRAETRLSNAIERLERTLDEADSCYRGHLIRRRGAFVSIYLPDGSFLLTGRLGDETARMVVDSLADEETA